VRNASWLVVMIRSRYLASQHPPPRLPKARRCLVSQSPRRPLTRLDIEGLAGTIATWLQLIDEGELEAGPVFRSELAGALTVLEVVLGREPSLRVTEPGGSPDDAR
jgi:hypothetical protein